MHTSFLSHAKGRYFWLAVLLMVGSVVIYAIDDPTEPANGGTWLGYALGTIGALLIVWLAYLGRRKRNFANGWGTVKGWVSAHVYLGSALLVVATLHTGFQFDWNVHTFAFVLMCLVIFSGFFGIFAYRTYPSARNELKKSQTLDDIFLQVEELDSQLVRLIADASSDLKTVVNSAIERTVIGGGFRDQLFGRDHSSVVVGGKVVPNKGQDQALEFLVQNLSRAEGQENKSVGNIVRTFNSRKRLLGIIREDIRMHAMVQVWLLFHVPVTFALIAALIAHIFSVFVYR
ncbi:MAG: hypothetical protein O3C68_01020 [Proteobacteria bacterium]|nr:hypothetical protein [Pseudomonadota bacterium]